MSEAGTTSSGYNRPSTNILEVMHAPSPPVPVLSPTGDRMIMVQWESYPTIERVANPYLRLAGVRVEPHNHSRRNTSHGHGIKSFALGYDLVHIDDGTSIAVKLPKSACLSKPIWSADGKLFAFRNTTSSSVEIWIGDGQTGAVQHVPNVRLNPMLSGDLQWMPDQRTLLAKLVPEQLGPPPKAVSFTGPSIQEAQGDKGQSSTYEPRDTLNSPHDEHAFDYYAASQLAFIDAASLAVHPIGEVDRYFSLDPAPDGEHLLVMVIRKPYSYVITFNRFPREVEVWNVSNRSKIIAHRIASRPLADSVPIHGVVLGPRSISWRPNAPATLIWAEALDEGNWSVDVSSRDKIMTSQAPFSAPPKELTRTEHRFNSIIWGQSPELAILTEYDLNRYWYRSFLINIDNPGEARRLLWDLSTNERYNDPGWPVFRKLLNGAWVMRQDGNSIFLKGDGSSPDGDRPFLDQLDLGSLKSRRLFRSSRSSYERFLAFDKAHSTTFITQRQTPNEPPNVFRRTLQTAIDAPEGEATFASGSFAITHFFDPTPIVRKIKKRLVPYERSDGVMLSFKLYTPPNYKEGTCVPAILYAYPLDYADESTAGQTYGSQATFTQLQNHLFLLLAGYAIIIASFPIIGNPKSVYDAYLEQLTANAKAAVNAAVGLGVVDPNRIGVTGHSHGAFMTVNLLAHSNLFQAGVATSGAYNKMLTPFGFQSERRSAWEAQEVYLKVSPFFAADKIKAPLLIVHGADDANPGTTPFQSNMLYKAIRGNGGTTRLVILPHEPHWYAALESNEQLVYEMVNWFDKHVKNR
jgi:dipeptidyl aminopeptidase/acylaminoacyl peptidase